MADAPTDLDQFVRLSAALTGIDAAQLKPALDPIGIADQYLQTLRDKLDAATLQSLLAAVPASPSDPVNVAALLADTTLGPVCRSILKLWLLGAWYSPQNPFTAVKVVSSQAYKESLVWRAMQSHPMGYSMFNFGYWAAEPPPLDQFLTFATPQAQHGKAPNA